VRLTGLENSKAVHSIRISDDAPASITHVAWSRTFIGKRTPRRPRKPRESWDKALSEGLDLDKKQGALDLPHELMFLDIETALPKISPLPVSGGSGYGFTSHKMLVFECCLLYNAVTTCLCSRRDHPLISSSVPSRQKTQTQ
jgi:anaphase-promoting complex subunit 4